MNERFTIVGEIVNRRGLTRLVSTRFLQGEVLAAYALATIREVPGTTL